MDGERVIGGYVLRRVLGRGGMGEVHLASTPTGSLAAVKVIHPALARDPAFRRRFEREVAAARRVARFCTAPVLDAGFDEETAYLVTEYVKGPDLAQAVRAQGAFSGANLEALAVGIATALSAIHGAGVIHRDLKPSNVLLSPLGPRVIDFGIAQLVDGDASVSQSILGTPAFMAPEQVRGEPLSPAADVYAWGGVIAFAGTGRLPFGGGAPHEVLYRIVNEGPALDGLEAGMRGLVERAMAKESRLRPTVQQLLADLMGGRQITPETATQVVENTWTGPANGREEVPADPGQDGAGRKAKRWPWVAGAVGLAAVVAGAVVVPLTARESWPYTADFGDAWAVGTSQGGTARQVGGAYVLTANAGWRLWKSAPRREPGDVVVSAKARLEQGEGEYGVWCHGRQGSGDRYEFTLNDQGKASIVKRRAGGQPAILYGPAEAKTAQDNRIVADCAGRTLRLWVNEELLAKVTDDQPFAPGEAGVLAAPSGDQAVRVRFTTFAVQPSKG
ncbi:protein kinase domain-containing protein [Nonomuraea sediminis]|uniref:protein kinase domain-containing protein n=1 Tax=Nonomuraea sediminis TaxID=2835864 RepID=UPI001BDD1796|nr:protein kinase [Nonomuraea sediminis]